MDSGIDMQFEGLGQIVSNLELVEQTINRDVNKALQEGGKVFEKAIIANTPTGPENVTQFKRHPYHAKDQVRVSRTKTQASTYYKNVEIGYNKKSYWYMWFLEKGTSRGIKPRHHVEKAFKSAHANAQQVMADELEEIVRKVETK